jgi:hypothetical protein
VLRPLIFIPAIPHHKNEDLLHIITSFFDAVCCTENNWPIIWLPTVLPVYHTHYDLNRLFGGRVMQSMKTHLPHDFVQHL